MSKRTLLVDFDGVLSNYRGWRGPDQLDSPLPQARHAMHILSKDFTLVCFTTRPAEPVTKWLLNHGFPHMRVTNIKDPAFLQIDDRAILFKGEWNDELLQTIRTFHPWWEATFDTSAAAPTLDPASLPADPVRQQMTHEPGKTQPADVLK